VVDPLHVLKELEKKLVFSYLPEEVRESLSGLDVQKVTTSTNDDVLCSSALQSQRFFVSLANQQTAGRGRNGKVWQSPSNAHIYMSVGSIYDVSLVKDMAGLSLACGVAVARLLGEMGFNVGLKWPNDVLVDDKKLAGILVETRIRSSEVVVVVGLGLNVDMPDSVAQDIDQPWTDLSSLMLKKDYSSVGELLDEKNVNRNYVAAKLIEKIMQSMKRYAETGFASFNDDWREFDVLSGREVIVRTSEENLVGRVTGFNKDYSVVVMIDNKEKIFYAADIKLKLNSHVSG